MHLARRNAHLCAHAKFSAIRKLRRGILHHNPAINIMEEILRGLCVLGENRICMMRAIAVDMVNRVLNAAYDGTANFAVQILGTPILRCCFANTGV